jgi:hypothetical protein
MITSAISIPTEDPTCCAILLHLLLCVIFLEDYRLVVEMRFALPSGTGRYAGGSVKFW